MCDHVQCNRTAGNQGRDYFLISTFPPLLTTTSGQHAITDTPFLVAKNNSSKLMTTFSFCILNNSSLEDKEEDAEKEGQEGKAEQELEREEEDEGEERRGGG